MKPLPPIFLTTPGAMSVHEGVALANLCGIVPDVGRIVECGSHAGKSAIALASGFAGGPPRELHMVDPLFEEEEFADAVYNRVESICPTVTPHLWPMTSLEAMPQIRIGPTLIRFAFAFLDSGDHAYELVRSEFDFLKDWMVPGGIIAFHDVINYTGPTKVYEEAQREGFCDVPIPWDEIHEIASEEGNDSWHLCGDPRPQSLRAVRKLSDRKWKEFE